MMINLQRQSLQVPSRDVNGGLTSVEFRPEIRTGFVGVLFFFSGVLPERCAALFRNVTHQQDGGSAAT